MNSTFYTLKYSDIPIFRIPNIVHILYYIDDKIFIIKLKIAKIYNVQKSSSGHRLSSWGKGARGEKLREAQISVCFLNVKCGIQGLHKILLWYLSIWRKRKLRFLQILNTNIQGVPINMGIQWRIRYRLLK